MLEGYDLGVVIEVVEVGAFADDFGSATVGRRLSEDAAYLGVGRREGYGLGGELEGSLHEDFVLWGGGHVVSEGIAPRYLFFVKYLQSTG